MEEKDILILLSELESKELYFIVFELCKYFECFFHKVETLLIYAKAASKVENYNLSYNIYQNILEKKNIDANCIKLVLKEKRSLIDKINKHYTYYDVDKVNSIKLSNLKTFPLVTFTITTCKRIDLFKNTVNSFINCCEDVHLISNWICVDDNSSAEDREEMQRLYPFFTFYFKNIEEKGHPRSMNIIKKLVTTPYLFHIEDDWNFFERRKYISECLEVLSQSKNIGQCLINKNYAETGEIDIIGGDLNFTKNNLRYYVHEYVNNKQLEINWYKKHGMGSHCHYWPHFSFRPSLIKTKIYKDVGEFNEIASHFEMEYSYRYCNKGYVSAFLEGIYSLHTGRLTSERNDKKVLNAYDLNDEIQFENKLDMKFKTYVINLDKRLDRYEKFNKVAFQLNFLNYERFSAIDGNLLESTPRLQCICDGNDYEMKVGFIGCALSHMQLYINLIESEEEAYLILEDDLTFIVPEFQNKLLHLYNQFKNLDWDIVYLGHHEQHRYHKNEITEEEKINMPKLEKWNMQESFLKSIGGTFAYFISKKGANKVLEFINEKGLTNGIDTILQKTADSANIFYVYPQLIHSECYRGINLVDSNIQYNGNNLIVSTLDRLKEEIIYYNSIGEDIIEGNVEMLKNITSINSQNFYFKNMSSENISFIKSFCVNPFYILGDNIVIVISDSTKCRYKDRLKKDGKFFIDDAIHYKT